MTIQTFIEKAIEGGWDNHGGWTAFEEHINDWFFFDAPDKSRGTHWTIQEILLDPTSWQAVGKVEGWHTADEKRMYPMYRKHPDGAVTLEENQEAPDWLIAMHSLIDALASDQTLEEFLATL